MQNPIIKIVVSLMLVLSSIGIVSAEESNNQNMQPGLTPDSPFYEVDKIGEKLQRFTAKLSGNREQVVIEHSRERIAEAKSMMTENKHQSTKVALDDYNRLLNKKLENKNEKTIDEVCESTIDNSDMLNDMKSKENTSKELKKEINDCLNVTEEQQEVSLGVIENKNKDKALNHRLEILKQKTDALKKSNSRGNGNNIERKVKQYVSELEKIKSLSENLTNYQQKKNIELQVNDSMEVLRDVHEKVPESGKEGIENALNKSQRHLNKYKEHNNKVEKNMENPENKLVSSGLSAQ